MPPADLLRIVTKESAAQIHVVFMGQGLQPEALEQRRLKGDYARVVAFRPTGGQSLTFSLIMHACLGVCEQVWNMPWISSGVCLHASKSAGLAARLFAVYACTILLLACMQLACEACCNALVTFSEAGSSVNHPGAHPLLLLLVHSHWCSPVA